MRRVARVFVLGGLLVTTAVFAPGQSQAGTAAEPSLHLEDLIREALEKNPAVQAAQGQWQGAREIIEARRALPDPQFSYTHFLENVETRLGPQRHIFGLKQMFPFYGKRDLKAGMAAQEAEAAAGAYEAVRQEVIRQVKNAYYDLFHVTRLADITTQEKDLLRRFEHIARTKYETGMGSQQSILKVHVEISQVQERLLDLERQRQTREAALNRLLDRPAEQPIGKPSQPKFRQFFFIGPQLARLAEEHRPELKAALALVQKSEQALELARKDYYPDLTVGANYIELGEGPLRVRDNGEDAFNVMFSINLPIWRDKLRAQVRSAEETSTARKKRYDDLLNQTLFEVQDNDFKIRSARETFDLYRNVLLPQAEQSLKSAEAGYVTGAASFLDLLDAERILLKIQFGYWKAFTDYLKGIADMERSVGMELKEYPGIDVPAEEGTEE